MISLLIGLGGIGTGVVRRVKKALEDSRAHSDKVENEVFFCSLDVDPAYDAEICKVDAVKDFKVSKLTELITTSSKDPEFLRWWIPHYKVTAPIEGTRSAGQIRINGRLAFYANYASIAKLVRAKIEAAKAPQARKIRRYGRASGIDTVVNVFVVSTLAGGTGSGMLVDTVFLLRSLLDEEDRIIGVLFDGSVVRQLTGDDRAPVMGLAALTEIEHWMADPESYSFECAGETIGGNARFFDICHIIEARNMDGRMLYGAESEVKQNYQMLAATYLEQIVTQPGVRTFIEANCWNRYDNLGLIEGRSCRYAGVAVSKITFPVEKVARYCYAKFVTETLASGRDVEGCPSVEVIERALGIHEQDGGRLTNVLRRSDSAEAFAARCREVADSVRSAKTPRGFLSACRRVGIADEDLTAWLGLVKQYRGEMAERLGAIEAQFRDRVLAAVLEFVSAFSFSRARLFLNCFKGSVENNTRHIYGDKRLWDKNTSLRAELSSCIDTAATAQRGVLTIGDRFPSARERFLETLNRWSLSELEAAEHDLMRGFYERLTQLLDTLLEAVDYLAEAFDGYAQDVARGLGGYVSRGWVVNPERFAAYDYLLNLELAASKEDIDTRIYPAIAELLREPMHDRIAAAGAEGITGVASLFRSIHDEFSGKPAGAKRRLNDRRGDIEADLRHTIEATFLPPIAAKVQETKVGDALDWFLARTYSEVVSPGVQQDAAAREQMVRRLAHIFKEDRAESLLTKIRDEAKWRHHAVEGLFRRIGSLTRPFVSVNEAQVTQVLATEQEALDKTWNRIVFLPEDFKYADAAMQLATEKARSDDQIVFYTQFNFFPLFALTDLARPEIGGQYASHVRTVGARLGRSQAPGMPYHTDRRFYGEWADAVWRPKGQDGLAVRESIQARASRRRTESPTGFRARRSRLRPRRRG